MIRTIKPIVVLACLFPLLLHAQDPRERPVSGESVCYRIRPVVGETEGEASRQNFRKDRYRRLNLKENSLFLQDNQIPGQ